MDRTLRFAPVLCLAVMMTVAANAKEGSERDRGLKIHEALSRDPMLVLAVSVARPADEIRRLVGFVEEYVGSSGDPADGAPAWIDAVAPFLEPAIAGRFGPEVAVSVDLPPLDATLAEPMVSGGVLQRMLGRTGLLIDARQTRKLRAALHETIVERGWQVTERDDRSKVEISYGEGPSAGSISVFLGFNADHLAVGFSPEWVRSALSERRSGERLRDGEDYAAVFSQLDAKPSTLSYVNLPRIRRWIVESRLAQLALNATPEGGDMLLGLLDEAAMSVGLGSTTRAAGGGARTVSYGPSWMSGAAVSSGMMAAMVLPNLTMSMDDARSRRTVDDIQQIGAACEGFSGGAQTLPETDGWVPVEKIAVYLEPGYIPDLPRTDGWRNPILFWSDGRSYRIISTGRDGLMDRDWTGAFDPIASAEGDIVFGDGRLLVVPERLVAE